MEEEFGGTAKTIQHMGAEIFVIDYSRLSAIPKRNIRWICATYDMD